MAHRCDIHRIEAFQVFIDPKTWREFRQGEGVRPIAEEIKRHGLIELRCAGHGWRWHDSDGDEWTTGIATDGHIWRKSRTLEPEAYALKVCPSCHGAGNGIAYERDGDHMTAREFTCGTCEGSGLLRKVSANR